MKTKLIFLYCAAFGLYSAKAQSPETIIRTVKDAYANSYYYSYPDYGSYYGDEYRPPRTSTVRKSASLSAPRQYYYYAEEDPERIIQVVKNAYDWEYDSYNSGYYVSDYYQPVKTYQQPAATYYYQQPATTYYYQQPATVYQQPVVVYEQQPATVYQQPVVVYEQQPASVYQQPASVYQQPAKTYQQPVVVYEQQPATVYQQQPASIYQQPVATVPQTQSQLDISLQTPKLTKIPDYVFNMRGLKILDLGYNRIGTISRQMLNLSQLEVLILSGNQYLNELPDFLGEMKNLRTVYLQGMGTWSEQKKYATVNRFKSKGIMVVTD